VHSVPERHPETAVDAAPVPAEHFEDLPIVTVAPDEAAEAFNAQPVNNADDQFHLLRQGPALNPRFIRVTVNVPDPHARHLVLTCAAGGG
jgi:hypothetical protein